LEEPKLLNNTIGGYIHNVLHVHLSNGKLTYQTPNDETLRRYLGGTGMGAKHLYDEVSPGVEWSDAENRLIFFSGFFGGTKVSGSGTFSVVTKGPMTNLAGASQANGFFGAFLKFSGFDGVSIQGKARKWQYLLINNGSGELRDAEHLKGKDTWETEDAIKKEIGKQCSVFCIGPAGENRVRFASIVGDHGHVVAHNGMGAVMGSKKLKAIVTVRGKQSVPIANPEQLTSASQALYEHAAKSDSNLGPWGTAWSLPGVMSAGILPVRNYTTNIFPEAEKLSGKYLRTHFKTTPTTCWACRMNHCRITEVTEGPYTGFVGEEPEYEGIAAMSSQIGQSDPGATVMLGN
jgi:aldehyde:ferredoxin oxidoreductase